MTPYLSLDIETTSLDAATGQIIEFAAVAETGDWTAPVAALPHLHLFVEHDRLTGDPVALAMNARVLAELAKPRGERSARSVGVGSLAGYLAGFIDAHFPARHGKPPAVTLAGKNVATFDWPFLKNLPDWDHYHARRFRHRVIDPGVLWMDPAADAKVPDTRECCRRAGVSADGLHSALEDARRVIELVRAGFAKRKAVA